MNEETLNLSVRKFHKTVGVASQREIETAVREALAAGRLGGSATLEAKMTLTVEPLGLPKVIEGRIQLE